ncbi:MAG: nucleotidyltransferase family protein [Halioglobus sp.]
MSEFTGPLLKFLSEGEKSTHAFSSQDWSLLIRQARSANLLSTVATQISGAEGSGLRIPDKVQLQIDNAFCVGLGSARSVRWEVSQISSVLSKANIPFVILKGAAYEMAGLPAAAGRLFADVDIMVPREQLESAEGAFLRNGWTTTKFNVYDQKYYRTWMHEIPPLQHKKRGTSLDVHHAIIPPTARLKPEVDKLWAAAIELPDFPGAYVLKPEDMVLHSATHLFHDGDLQGGLRDLYDLDVLIQHFSKDSGFMGSLLDRAIEMDLLRPLYYALKYDRKYFDASVADEVLAKCNVLAAPPAIIGCAMDSLVKRAFYPGVEPNRSLFSSFAKWVLYVRSHYLRMPLYLLLPHLVRKAIKPDGV